MYTAFSRQHPTEKVYVQHLLAKHDEEIRELIISRNAHVYICGDAHRMAKDVFTEMSRVVSMDRRYGGNSEKATLFLRSMKSEGRWSEDVW